MAAVLLIGASVAGISYQALAAPVDAPEIVDTAAAFHDCRHTDGCASATAVAFHDCRHGDGCHDQTQVLAAHPGHDLPPNMAI